MQPFLQLSDRRMAYIGRLEGVFVLTFNQVVPGSSPGCLTSVKRLKALIYKALSHFLCISRYIKVSRVSENKCNFFATLGV